MKIIKRGMDFSCSLLAVLVLSPVLGLISLILLCGEGRPVLFRQQRVGKDGKIFTIYKFRTMRVDAPECATQDLMNAHEFITPFGHFLRRTSLDELPQFFNVLKGDMSLVGPRPLALVEEQAHLLRQEAGVYAMRPGLTGLAQVNGRDDLSVEDKVAFDREYVKNYSFFMDLKILCRTIVVVFRHEGFREGDE